MCAPPPPSAPPSIPTCTSRRPGRPPRRQRSRGMPALSRAMRRPVPVQAHHLSPGLRAAPPASRSSVTTTGAPRVLAACTPGAREDIRGRAARRPRRPSVYPASRSPFRRALQRTRPPARPGRPRALRRWRASWLARGVEITIGQLLRLPKATATASGARPACASNSSWMQGPAGNLSACRSMHEYLSPLRLGRAAAAPPHAASGSAAMPSSRRWKCPAMRAMVDGVERFRVVSERPGQPSRAFPQAAFQVEP